MANRFLNIITLTVSFMILDRYMLESYSNFANTKQCFKYVQLHSNNKVQYNSYTNEKEEYSIEYERQISSGYGNFVANKASLKKRGIAMDKANLLETLTYISM